MAKQKTLQDLTIKDNFMFGAVMVDEEICRELLELVLGFQIAKVTVSREKCFVYHPEYKGVRLDVVAADENSTHYNVEMQVSRKAKPGKRSRYYHSQIDMELLRAGQEYAALPDSYVIFICDFDPFHKKKYRYTFDMVCREDAGIPLEDGSHTVFLSTCGENEEEVPAELVKFLRYVRAGLEESTEDFKDEFVKRIQDAVRNVKASREMEEQFMLLEELIKEEREEAAKQAGRQATVETLKEAILAILDHLSECNDMPVDDIRQAVMDEDDSEVLRVWFNRAVCAETPVDFRRAIAESLGK